MISATRNRLLEAGVVVDSETFGLWEGVVAELAKPARADIEVGAAQLDAIFGVALSDAHRRALDAPFQGTPVQIGRDDDNLRRALALALLTSRWGRGRGARRETSLAGDTYLALAAQHRIRRGLSPIHPDVGPWSRYWLERIGIELRRNGARVKAAPQPALPKFQAPSAFETPESAASANAEALSAFAVSLGEWAARRSSSFGPTAVQEELEVLWWLETNHESVDAALDCVDAASELAELVRFVPGPPRAAELLSRRLGIQRFEPLDREVLTQALNRRGLPGVALELGLDASEEVRSVLTATEASFWIYETLLYERLRNDHG